MKPQKVEIAGEYYTQNEESLDLSGKGLKEIPDFRDFTKLKFINLYNNRIREITNLPPGIEELILDANEITEIPDLKGYTKLWKLFLRKNKISKLVIDNLPLTIHSLFLADNQITQIEKPAAKGRQQEGICLWLVIH